jgi:hypothetical protein
MSKVEDKAKEFLKKLVSHATLYKGTIDELEVYEPDDVIWAYKEGYEEAEKDLELTIEDIERIHTFLYAIKHNKQGVFTFTRLSDEQYQEVLRRYKDYKERKEKCQ